MSNFARRQVGRKKMLRSEIIPNSTIQLIDIFVRARVYEFFLVFNSSLTIFFVAQNE